MVGHDILHVSHVQGSYPGQDVLLHESVKHGSEHNTPPGHTLQSGHAAQSGQIALQILYVGQDELHGSLHGSIGSIDGIGITVDDGNGNIDGIGNGDVEVEKHTKEQVDAQAASAIGFIPAANEHAL